MKFQKYSADGLASLPVLAFSSALQINHHGELCYTQDCLWTHLLRNPFGIQFLDESQV